LTRESLLAYKEIYGNLNVPKRYIIDIDDIRYPERMRGKSLGSIVYSIRNKGCRIEYKEELKAMGFEYEKQKGDYSVVKEALQAYKEIHGHLKVPNSYVISKDDSRYPERMRGKSLGSIVCGIRNVGCFSDHKEELIALGVDYEKRIVKVTFAQLQEALLIYKQLHGHLKIPAEFVIAKDDLQYPEEIRGYGLGYAVYSIRNNRSYREHREDFVAMGLNLSSYSKDEILSG